MAGRPEDDWTQRPERCRVRNVCSLSGREQAGDDLCRQAEQPQICEAESKGNAEGKAPLGRLWLMLHWCGLSLMAQVMRLRLANGCDCNQRSILPPPGSGN